MDPGRAPRVEGMAAHMEGLVIMVVLFLLVGIFVQAMSSRKAE